MNEEEFRDRMHRALGEPPASDLSRRLVSDPGGRRARRPSALVASLAATLALLMVGGLVGWRLVNQRTTAPARVTPSPVSSAAPTIATVDPLNCRLPVVVMRESGPPGQLTSEPGFVDTATGHYTKDPAASIVGLPGGAFEGTIVKPPQPAAAVWYSAPAGRWLPVGRSQVGPDGRSYVWTRLLPPGANTSTFKTAELHRFDLVTATDHLLWTYAGYINVHSWDSSGILVDTDPAPPTGGQVISWLIDPGSGIATQQPQASDTGRLTTLPGDAQNGGFSYESFGSDGRGHTLYRIGSRQAGDREWIFYETAPGQRVTIYKGQQGDAMGFDPFEAISDGTGIWMSDYEMRGLWHWDVVGGLHKIAVKGLPALLSGPNSSEYVNPAGSCIA